ncbi:CRISPR-associated endonuclease Cas2 [Persephonella sp.]
MRFIVCYDISDNRTRNKVSKLLKSYGIRTQLSVFEVEADINTVMSLLQDVEQMIDIVDKFFVYPVGDVKAVIRLGKAQKGNIFNIV